MTRTTARDVTCPDCAAPPRTPCTRIGTGQTMSTVHAARRTAAKTATPAPAVEAIVVDTAGTATPTPAAELPALPTDPVALATQLLILRALRERVAEADGDLREHAATVVPPGASFPGRLDPGQPKAMLGKVTMTTGSETWRIVDADALTEWCLRHYPDELEVRPTVRTAFLGVLTAGVKAHGQWIDPATGEALGVPDGIECRTGAPTLSVRLAKDAQEQIGAAIAAGRLRADGTLALDGGAA